MPDENIVFHRYDKSPEPCKIKLIKQSKAWAWEISKSGSNFEEIIKEIDAANEIMLAKYGGIQA